MPQSHTSWIVRVWLPFLLVAGYLFLIVNPAPETSTNQSLVGALFLSPALLAGWWMASVPADLVLKEDGSVTVVRWRSTEPITRDVVESANRGFWVYSELCLRSGRRLKYVKHDGNKAFAQSAFKELVQSDL